jgi:hypothetical protein
MAKVTSSRKRQLETENEEDTNKPSKVQRTGESSASTPSSQQPTTTAMAPTSPSSYYGQYAMSSVRYTSFFCFCFCFCFLCLFLILFQNKTLTYSLTQCIGM